MSEERVADIMGTCVHFTGTRDARCAAGVAYAAVRLAHAPIPYRSRPGGPEYRATASLPCIARMNRGGATCAARCTKSRAEAEAQAAREDEEVRHMVAARDQIIRATGNRGGRGSVPCPRCGGTLEYSQATTNKHVMARCRTAECLAWME